MAALTMRGLARSLNISPGNLNYYYQSKSNLLQDLVDFVLDPYLVEFRRLRSVSANSPEAQLRSVFEYVYDELGQRPTTHFFPELWALALRHDWAQRQMERMYSTYRKTLRDLILILRPDLDLQTIRDITLTVSASIEGHTVFIGYGKSHEHRAKHIKSLLIDQLMSLVTNAERPPTHYPLRIEQRKTKKNET